MRRLLVLLVLGALAAAGQVSAAPLASASFSFQWVVNELPALTLSASGATGTATSDLSASLDAGTAFNGQVTATNPTATAPSAPLSVIQLIVTKNAGQTFTGSAPGNVGGNLAVQGVFNVYGIGTYPSGGAPLLSVPLVIGTPNTLSKAGGGVALTVVAGSWTAGTAAVTGVQTGYGYGTVTAMGANALTPDGAGTLLLVSPVKIADGVAGYTAAFGILSLTYVPEPGTFLLLGLGVAGLAALGRGRM